MTRRKTVWCAAALAAAAVIPASAADAPEPAADAAWMGVRGARAERVAEPVFGGDLVLYRAGTRGAEPVVLVHGLGQNGARDWANVVPALAPRYEVWALDLPGFGASDKRNELYSPENYVKVLEQAVAPRVGRPFSLVGHSMGAAIALGYAAAHPQRVRRLVLADMAGILHGPVYAESLAKFGIEQKTGLPEDSPWLDTVIGRVMTRAENLPLSRETILNTPLIRGKMLRGDPNLIAAFALGEHDFGPALRTIAVPTLLIWGAEDRIAPLRTGQLASHLIRGARLELVPDAGHVPMADDPQRFNALLLEHLAGTRAPPAAVADGGPLGERVGKCDGQSGARFNGDFQRLTLIQCRGAQVANARIGELRVLESDVQITGSEIRGGLYALRSSVELTAGSVAGAPAMKLQDSTVDAAGTRFDGGGAVVQNVGEAPVSLRFSVAELRRGSAAPRTVHGRVRVAAGESW